MKMRCSMIIYLGPNRPSNEKINDPIFFQMPGVPNYNICIFVEPV